MKLKLRVFDVPLHPLLVHFPIAFWLVVPVLDIAALYAGPDPWWTMAQAATILGIVIGAASIAVGLLEYLQPSFVGVDLKLAARHGIRTSLAWCIFTAKSVAASLLPIAGWSMISYLALDLIGCVLLVQGVYFGKCSGDANRSFESARDGRSKFVEPQSETDAGKMQQCRRNDESSYVRNE
jgi:uncharacterized membrane protein